MLCLCCRFSGLEDSQVVNSFSAPDPQFTWTWDQEQQDNDADYYNIDDYKSDTRGSFSELFSDTGNESSQAFSESNVIIGRGEQQQFILQQPEQQFSQPQFENQWTPASQEEEAATQSQPEDESESEPESEPEPEQFRRGEAGVQPLHTTETSPPVLSFSSQEQNHEVTSFEYSASTQFHPSAQSRSQGSQFTPSSEPITSTITSLSGFDLGRDKAGLGYSVHRGPLANPVTVDTGDLARVDPTHQRKRHGNERGEAEATSSLPWASRGDRGHEDPSSSQVSPVRG